jgi:hypothetical protein
MVCGGFDEMKFNVVEMPHSTENHSHHANLHDHAASKFTPNSADTLEEITGLPR